MRSPQARADRLVEDLSTAGFTPQLTDHKDHLGIEMTVPQDTSDRSWEELLRLLEQADWFGLVDSRDRGRTAWAAISKENAPETARTAARGHSHQL